MERLFQRTFFLRSAAAVLIVIGFASCDSNRIFEQNQAMPESGWDVTNSVKFDVDIKDPATATNFYINVRQADDYKWENLLIFFKTVLPNGATTQDTLDCRLADKQGKWIGSGAGDIYDNRIPFKRNVRFPMPGMYHFEIIQGMRMETVPQIMDIGLRIEKVE
jgi:gliding motility-associated lipoprotein GldH